MKEEEQEQEQIPKDEFETEQDYEELPYQFEDDYFRC